jgi:hypothetical protein
MTHDKVQALTDLAAAGMTLQDQLRPLEQKRGLGCMLLGGELLKPAIKVLGTRDSFPYRPSYQCRTPSRLASRLPWRDDVANPDWAAMWCGFCGQKLSSSIMKMKCRTRPLQKMRP